MNAFLHKICTNLITVVAMAAAAAVATVVATVAEAAASEAAAVVTACLTLERACRSRTGVSLAPKLLIFLMS